MADTLTVARTYTLYMSNDQSRIDKRGELEAAPFSYRALKNGSVLLEHHGRTVKTISGDAAERFLKRVASLEGLEEQLVLAKLTGNFKRGNERAGSKTGSRLRGSG
jgi:hypothetical protein